MSAPLPLLGAPTASGKSATALKLALELQDIVRIEIITADAMQVYRGLDIGTAKPTPAEQQLVPHHLIDLVTPAEQFSVARWVEAAEQVIAEVLARGAVPFVVGGTGFYLRSLTEGLPLVPPADQELQAPIWLELEQDGLEPLQAELARVSEADAERAGANPRRLVRAVEILRRTGRPPSAFGRSEPAFTYDRVALLPSVEQLDPRISKRSRQMFEAGLVEEARVLLERWPEQQTVLQAIGYKEVIAHLRGEYDLGTAMEAVRSATARYARRQLTWFRRERDARQLTGLAHEFERELADWLIGFRF